ncbi:M23 family metallopeptidase [soil metagenome]
MAEGLSRRLVIAGGLAATPLVAFAAEGPLLQLDDRPVQGGFAIGRTRPGARVMLDEEVLEVSPNGLFFLGFDRDAPPQAKLTVRDGRSTAEHDFSIADGKFDVQSITGLPQDTVTPEDPALLARIAKESERKAAGFASHVDGDDFKDGFAMPLNATRVSGRFGGQRILNGTPNRPHYGADLAAPTGTPIHAPAAGIVAFAETGLHFEGGLVLIDHGQGLISAYLHQSKVLVAKGDSLVRGQPIGAVGMEGRATGPHLCWRLKWRGRNLDPTLLVGAVAPRP